jgi:hypothetical protein
MYPLQVENGNKMFTKMKINPNIQVLLKDLRHNSKKGDIASIFRKKWLQFFNLGIIHPKIIWMIELVNWMKKTKTKFLVTTGKATRIIKAAILTG